MAQNDEMGLPISEEAMAMAWQLIDRIAPDKKDNFMLALEKDFDNITAFVVSKGHSDPESDDEVDFLFGEDLKEVLERVARIDMKSEELRIITEENSEKIKKIEGLAQRAETIIKRIGNKLDIG